MKKPMKKTPKNDPGLHDDELSQEELLEKLDRKTEIIKTQQQVIGMQMERNRRLHKAFDTLSVYVMELFSKLEDLDMARNAFYKWQVANNELEVKEYGDY